MTIVLFPILIPFIAGLFLLLFRENKKWQHSISLISGLLMLLASVHLIQSVSANGVLVLQMGNWKPPFGISFAVDMLGALMTLVSAIVGLTTVIYAFHDIDTNRMKGSFYALFHFLLFGINGAFLTGDLFNLFVFFEVVLMASYVLLVLGNEHKQVKSGLPYLILNLIGSTLFLAGAGIIFGQLGTLNMAHIASRIDAVQNKELVTLVAMIFFFVFGLKSAMFPVNNWLPDSYITPPTPVSAIFAGLLTKVGVYSMFRVFSTVFSHDVSFTHQSLLIPLAGLTMLLGVWGAVVQYDIRSILAFHSISQVGYILMGLGIFSPLALAAGIFHMIHHSLIKSSLFLIGGGVGIFGGTQNLKKLGGLVKFAPMLGLFFMISSMALAGIPPLSGFFSKYGLVVSGLAKDHPILVFAAMVTGLFTLYSMIKIWRLGFWGEEPNGKYEKSNLSSKALVSCGISVVFVLLLSLGAGPIMKLCQKAGNQLLDRDQYIQTVLRHQPAPYAERSGQ